MPTYDPTAHEDAREERMRQLTLTDGLERKEAGQALVMDNQREHWKRCVSMVISDLARVGVTFTGDNVRQVAAAKNVPEPHHPNAWGAAISAAAKAKRIRKTGRYLPSAIASRHGAMVAEWVGVK